VVVANIDVQVISLRNSTERRLAISKSLECFPIPWKFFDACSGTSNVGLDYNQENATNWFGRALSNNEVGCFKSHYTVINNFLVNREFDWLIVFEDDLIVDPLFDYLSLVKYMKTNDIRYMRLHCRRWKSARVVGYFMHRQILCFRTDPFGTQSYILNKDAASAILSGISDIRRPIDDEFGRFWKHGVDIIGLFPFPVLETSTASILEESRAALSSKAPAKFSQRATRMLLRGFDKIGKIYANVSRDLSKC